MRSNSGQSEIIGLVLIIGLTVVASVGVGIAGMQVIDSSRDNAELSRMEYVMTQVDSRSAMVGIGDDRGAEVDLGTVRRGQVNIDEDAGWLRITHQNYTEDRQEVIYNGTLGAARYQSGNTVIAYQGGGVWRTDGNGTVMVTPPEFFYRGSTLTLPLVRVKGEGSASGQVTATVRRPSQNANRIFPNGSKTYSATDEPYQNVISDGHVTITVQSEFYQSWARYWRDRTAGSVTVDHTKNVATVDLVAFGTVGDFDMPPEGSPVKMRGVPPGHEIDNFTIILAPDDSDAAKFDNLQWSFHGEQGNRQIEIHLRMSGVVDRDDSLCKEQTVAASIYFSETNGRTYHGWQNETAFRTTCVDRDNDGKADETQLVANLTGAAMLSPTDLKSSDTIYFNTQGAPRVSPVRFDEHQDTVDWEPRTFNDSCEADSERCYDRTTIDNLTNHYLARMGPNYDLIVYDKNSDTVNEDESWGVLEYDGEGRITYLHVTERRIRIGLR